MVPVVYDSSYDRYFFGPEHPFSPTRQHMLLDLLAQLGHVVTPVAPEPASTDDLLAVHSPALLAHVASASDGSRHAGAARFGLGTPDVPIFRGMDEAARILAGGTLHAARLIESGDASVVLQLGGGLHHAHHDAASGFCVYNDLGAAIAFFRRCGRRVAYLDLDVHHGDGVQEMFYSDRDVLTVSLHESGRYLYPGSGFVHEIGEGAGAGFAINVPFEPGTSDDSYIECFERVVPHALSWFQPDVMVVQCGADAHYADPLADLLLTTHAYEHLFRRSLELVQEHAHGRGLFTLGGGYDLDATTRVWAILYLILTGSRVPRELPPNYLEEWGQKLRNVSLSRTLHDDPRDLRVEQTSSINNQNRLVSKRVLEMVVPHWH